MMLFKKASRSFSKPWISVVLVMAIAACEASERVMDSSSLSNVIDAFVCKSILLMSCKTPIISCSWSFRGITSIDFEQYPVPASNFFVPSNENPSAS